MNSFRLVLVGVALALAAPGLAQEPTTQLQWPRQIDAPNATVVIYQPQVEGYKDNILTSRAAVSVKRKSDKTPVFGAIWTDAFLSVDKSAGTVSLDKLTVKGVKFPELADTSDVNKLRQLLEREIPKWNLTLSIDQLVASLEAAETVEKKVEEGFSTEAPDIIFSTVPAVLVILDGDPILEDDKDTGLKRVVNTPFVMVQDPKTKTFYLRGDGNWFSSSKAQSDDWTKVTSVPRSLSKLDEAVRKDEAKAAKDQADLAKQEGADAPAPPDPSLIPKIYVRSVPAELLQTSGEPEYTPLQGTQLLYVKNTEDDILMDISKQQTYVLIAGRWYASPSLESGPWKLVPADKVPEDFRAIPADSDMGNVRASVAGTEEAMDAVLENTIPQTATVDRKTATVEVKYDGDPQFISCGGGVAYAKNTDKAVFLIDDVYFCCDEAIWFTSKGPSGPWEVATSVPEAIQDLPPDCPHYNVKYVTIYETTPEVVVVGYTPGYTSSYIYGGCVVYGTGWYYQPWYGSVYYPRPVTYGFSVHYNPYTGWGFSYGVSVGWMHFGVSTYHPYHGGYWGAGGYHYGYHGGYNHGYHNGYHHGYNQGFNQGFYAGYKAGQRNGKPTPYHSNANMYANRNSGVVSTGAVNRNSPSTRPSTGQAGTANRPSTKPASKPAARPNNVYTDKSGNVHRQNGNTWESRDNGKWSSSQKPSKGTQPSTRQNNNSSLNRDAQARSRGAQQTQQRSRSSAASRGGGRRN